MPRALFALDHNYPLPILSALADYIPEAQLVPLSEIDPRLPELEDWQILVALRLHARPWAGLVTNDADFLTSPRELAALIQTGLAVVVADAVGHDPIKATGLLLTHLQAVCMRLERRRPQLWHLTTAERRPIDPKEVLAGVAKHRKRSVDELYSENQLSSDELERDPLAAPLPGGET
jgi:hypothetical protein